MSKEIICVYQDCPFCGDRGKKLKQLIFDKNLNVRKVSFASPEGKELCYKAVFEHKIVTMPFFTDGKIFSTRLDKVLEQPKKPAKKPRARKITKKKEVENGSDS